MIHAGEIIGARTEPVRLRRKWGLEREKEGHKADGEARKNSGMKGYTQGPIQPTKKEVASNCSALQACSSVFDHM